MRILYGTDGSRTARGALEQFLASFALGPDSIVDVMAVEPEDVGAGVGADAIAAVNIEAATDRLAEAGVDASSVAAVGDPAAELIARAETTGPDIVLLGADRGGIVGPHPLAASIGHVAATVALDGHASAFVSASDAPIRRVVIAADGSAEAERALQLFLELPFRTKPDVIVLTVADSAQADGAYGAGGGAALAVRESTTVARAIAAEAAETVRHAAVSVEIRTPVGVPAEQIPIAARSLGADLVVVGTRGLAVRQRRRVGSVTAALLDRLPTSLLVARAAPEGPATEH